MNWREVYPQQRAEDIFLRHRFLYYVLHRPTMSDHEFDLMHTYFLSLYPQSAILNSVGSDNAADYPVHVVRGWRPQAHERR